MKSLARNGVLKTRACSPRVGWEGTSQLILHRR